MNIGAATTIGQGPTFSDRIVIHVTKCIHLLWSNVMLALCQKLNHRNAGIFGPQHACKSHVLRRRVRRASKWCVLEAIRKWFLLWQRMSSSPFKIYDSFKSEKVFKELNSTMIRCAQHEWPSENIFFVFLFVFVWIGTRATQSRHGNWSAIWMCINIFEFSVAAT